VLIGVVDALAALTAQREGERAVNERTHGQQFRARFLKTSAPISILAPA
jgi:hypothetical protein